MKLSSIVIVTSLSLGSSSAWAAFTGAFDLGAPINQSMVVSGSNTFGSWNSTTVLSNVASTGVDTTSAPNQLTLVARGEMDSDLISVGQLTFSSGIFASDLTVTFDISVSGTGVWEAGFNYNGESVVLSPGSNSYTLHVSAGSLLEFVLSATGQGTTSVEDGPGGPGGFDDPGMGVEGFPSDVSLLVSNFTVSSAIPEPSSYALMIGGLAFAVTSIARRRRS